MTTPSIQFIITDRGKNKVLDFKKNGLTLRLAKFAYGTGKHKASASDRFLNKKVGEADIVSGDVEEQSHTLRFSVTLYADTITKVYEIGLLDIDGDLFAIASSYNAPLFVLYPNTAFTASFGLLLDEFERDQITVVTDPDGALSVTLMQQHLAHGNPHPQYVFKHIFDTFKDRVKRHVQDLNIGIGYNRFVIEAHAQDKNAHAEIFKHFLKTDVTNMVGDRVRLVEKKMSQLIKKEVSRLEDKIVKDSSRYHKAPNGYTYLPNGLLLQWGTVDINDVKSEKHYRLQFHKYFEFACYNLQATRKISSSYSSHADGGVLIKGFSKNGADISLQTFDIDYEEDLRGFTWFAIGY